MAKPLAYGALENIATLTIPYERKQKLRKPTYE
jgi:hypothetical protein